jgi:hypothetical protein
MMTKSKQWICNSPNFQNTPKPTETEKEDWSLVKSYITFSDPPHLRYLNVESTEVLRKGNINFLSTLTWKTKEEVEKLYDNCYNRLCFHYKDSLFNSHDLHERTLLEVKRLLK